MFLTKKNIHADKCGDGSGQFRPYAFDPVSFWSPFYCASVPHNRRHPNSGHHNRGRRPTDLYRRTSSGLLNLPDCQQWHSKICNFVKQNYNKKINNKSTERVTPSLLSVLWSKMMAPCESPPPSISRPKFCDASAPVAPKMFS